jgi:hypothetical protein
VKIIAGDFLDLSKFSGKLTSAERTIPAPLPFAMLTFDVF